MGDLLPPPSLGLAHASFAEGLLVAETLAGVPSAPVDYAAVPRVTYSSPQTASVGLTEAEARARGHEADVNTMPLTAVAKGMVHGQGCMVKVIAEQGGGQVLGVHLVGPNVSEIVAESRLIVGWTRNRPTWPGTSTRTPRCPRRSARPSSRSRGAVCTSSERYGRRGRVGLNGNPARGCLHRR